MTTPIHDALAIEWPAIWARLSPEDDMTPCDRGCTPDVADAACPEHGVVALIHSLAPPAPADPTTKDDRAS